MKKLDSIVVYCKCGNIIFAVLEAEKTQKDQQIIDDFFNRGNYIGKYSKTEVKKKIGCKCVKK